jgi:hypothetical protein
MTYEEICKRLGFHADSHFVEIEPDGSISFTTGKPDEIRELYAAVEREGMQPAPALRKAWRQETRHTSTHNRKPQPNWMLSDGGPR